MQVAADKLGCFEGVQKVGSPGVWRLRTTVRKKAAGGQVQGFVQGGLRAPVMSILTGSCAEWKSKGSTKRLSGSSVRSGGCAVPHSHIYLGLTPIDASSLVDRKS